MGQIGATGKFPEGMISPDDEGELVFGIAKDPDGNVILDFGKPIKWIAMPPATAIKLAEILIKMAGN